MSTERFIAFYQTFERIIKNIKRISAPVMQQYGLRSVHTTAVLDKEFGAYVPDFTPGRDSTASVHLTKYTPRYLDYEYTASKPGTIVFSEIYYPYGWKATVDGNPADIYRVNYMLRAINVPAGKHTIHMEFAPDSVKKGDTIAMICIFIMYASILLIVALSIYHAVRRQKMKE